MMTVKQLWESAQNYIKESKFDEALDQLNQALEIEPENANVLSERAVVYFHQGDAQKALDQLDYCVLLDPQNPYRYSSRAYIKAFLKDIKGAIEDYEKCIMLDPDDAIAYNNMGLLLESQGRIEQAKRNFERADELEGILKERGISTEHDQTNIAADTQETLANDENNSSGSTWSIVKGLFTNRKIFKEYLDFLKNGMKMKDKNKEE